MPISPYHSLQKHDSPKRRISYCHFIPQPFPSLFRETEPLNPLTDNTEQTENRPSPYEETACISWADERGSAPTVDSLENLSKLEQGQQLIIPRNASEDVPKSPSLGVEMSVSRKGSEVHVRKHQLKPIPRPDRFIPRRTTNGTSVTTYHVGKFPQRLTPKEKLLRKRDQGENPFTRRRSRAIRSVRSASFQEVIRIPHLSPHLIDDPVLTGGHASGRVKFRQVSGGSIWKVGGAYAATEGPWLGISDGMGGYSRSGMTATMHVARFFNKPSPSEESEMNESRLTFALGLDPAHRLLNFGELLRSTDINICPSSPQYEKCFPLTWKDNSWKRAELLPSKLFSFS